MTKHERLQRKCDRLWSKSIQVAHKRNQLCHEVYGNVEARAWDEAGVVKRLGTVTEEASRLNEECLAALDELIAYKGKMRVPA